MQDHKISSRRAAPERAAFLVFVLLVLLLIFFGEILYTNAQSVKPTNDLGINPYFAKLAIASSTNVAQAFSIIYGRLDYISNQIKQLQDRQCVR